MYLEINGERQISEIQKDFSAVYPFLKIEFFKNGNIRRDRYPMSKLVSNTRLVKEAWYWKKDKGLLEISDSVTVTQFENALMDQFGLSAQVFRKSGNLWLETTMTDNWTLKQQNDHGKEITLGKGEKVNPDDVDYELNRDANQ